MDRAGERVRVEEITTVSYGDGRETFVPWPLSWSAVWVGTLSAVALALVFSVLGSFLAFALGGWVAAKVAGLRRSESAMLHGAIAWVVAVPILVVLASMGAASYFGGWYGGLAGLPPAAAAQAFAAAPDPAAAMAARNAALAAVTALLLGLMGGVVGGWMGSGEPMTFTHYRTRRDRAAAGGW
jgi:hypothetical protein